MQDLTKRPQSLRNITHPISTGTTALIIDLDDVGAYVDGLANIRGHSASPHEYRVRFLGDPLERIRVAHPLCQHNPLAFVECVNALMHLKRQRALDDFFRFDDKAGGGR